MLIVHVIPIGGTSFKNSGGMKEVIPEVIKRRRKFYTLSYMIL
jgi:hypothetical protein